MNISEKIYRFFDSVENSGNFKSWALYISAVIIVRNGIESFISNGKLFRGNLYYSEYPMFYIIAFLLCAILFGIYTPPAKKSSRVSALGMILIFLAPFLDILFLGNGFPLGYLNFHKFGDFISAMFSLYITLPFYPIQRGLSPGLRIELYIILILIGLYIYIKTKSIWKSILIPYIFNILLFTIASVLYINSILSKILLYISPTLFSGTRYINPASTYTIILFILAIIWIYILNKRIVYAIFKYFRPIRFLHYGGMILGGIWLGVAGHIHKLYYINYIELLAMLLGYITLWIFAVFINYYFDYESDLISKNNSPLVDNIIDKNEVSYIVWTSLIIGLICLGSQKGAVFKVATVFSALAYLYSAPPARLKRIPIVATLTLGFTTLSGMLLGYSFIRGNIDKFPPQIALATIVCVTLGFCTKDLKDISGDRKSGTFTIPVIFGYRNGKIICAIFSASAFILIPIIAGHISHIPILIATGLAIFTLIYILISPKPRENILLLISIAYSIIYLIFWYPFNI